MTDVVLDTSVVVAASPTLASLPLTAALSVVTLGELRAGVLLAGDDGLRSDRERWIAEIRGAFLTLPVDERVADAYGDLLALARRERRTEKATDLFIVATALAHDRALFTLDQRQARLARVAGVTAGPS